VRALVGGEARGEVIVLDEGLSFWGGFDPMTGRIIDRAHPQHGESLAGKIVVMPHGRGSSSASSVLAESLRLGTGPTGMILDEPDQILVIGSLVARLLYGVECPIYVGHPAESNGDEMSLGRT
jgi:predicted aconitase with swiveling domain